MSLLANYHNNGHGSIQGHEKVAIHKQIYDAVLVNVPMHCFLDATI